MKLSAFVLPLTFTGLGVTASLLRPNRVVGVWDLVNATYTVNGEVTDPPYGSNPHGLLAFTTSGWFVQQINAQGLPTFPNDLASGSDEDIIAVALGTFGISGTYVTDDNGDFFSQKVLGCAFPNWQGIIRNTTELRLDVSMDRQLMLERLVANETTIVDIVWRKVG
jgi:hypothetical protein